MQRHDELREMRLTHALMRHKATIIESFFESYNKLIANLSEEYYKYDIDTDQNILSLTDREIDNQIQYHRRNYHRYKEVTLAFMSVKSLLEKLKHITEDL